VERFKGGSVIPPLGDGDKEETRSVDSWAAWRAQQVIEGGLKPESKSGN
jgi:hypothetical protein